MKDGDCKHDIPLQIYDILSRTYVTCDITAFEPGSLGSLLVEHVESVTVDFEMISIGGRIFL